MKKLTHSEISKKRATLDTIEQVNKLPVTVVLNSIRSSYNVGSIFRKTLYLRLYSPPTQKGCVENFSWFRGECKLGI